MRYFILVLLAVTAFFSWNPALKALVSKSTSPQLVGTTVSTFTVDNKGGAAAAISIYVPPGTSGMAPSLSLNYNSHFGDGLAGQGWMLSGFSTISRCSIKRNDVNYPVTYTVKDRFCLDGQLLVSTKGTYGADQTIYHTEAESWIQVQSHGTCGSGPCYFTAQTREGSIHYYGQASGKILAVADVSSTARIPSGSVRLWALDLVQDRNYNQMTYTYNQSAATGEYTPATILYTENNKASPALPAQHAVTFAYKPRTYPLSYYQGGAKISHENKLDTITSCVSTTAITDCSASGIQLAHRYKLNYETSTLTHKDLLHSVTEYGTNGSAFPPTIFDYQQAASPSFESPKSWITGVLTANSGWDVEAQPRHMTDINGDGRGDIVGFGSDHLYTALSTGDGFSTPVKQGLGGVEGCYTQSSNGQTSNCVYDYPRMMGDVNGDGYADIIALEGYHSYVRLSNGKTYENAVEWPTELTKEYGWDGHRDVRQIVDLNGDGRSDIIAFGQKSTKFLFSDGTKFTPSNPSEMTDFSTADGYSMATGNPPVMVDVNGDGINDIVGLGMRCNVYVGIATGTGFTKQQWSSNFANEGGCNTVWDQYQTPRRLADINGDGMADIVGFRESDVIVAFSTGQSFTAPVTWKNTTFSGWDDSSGSQRILGDINGDGRADIIGMGNEKVSFAVSTGMSFDTSAIPPIASKFGFGPVIKNPRFPIPVTGHNIVSLLVFDDEAVNVATPPSPKVDLLTSITNGIGGKTLISYGSISASDASTYYTPMRPKEKSSYYREYHVPIYVVTDYTLEDGRGSSYTYNYSYGGAVARTDQTGFLGFQTVTATNKQINPDAKTPGRSKTTYFQHSFNVNGTWVDHSHQVKTVMQRTADSKIISITNHPVLTREIAQGITLFYPGDETVQHFSLISDGSYTTKKTASIDQYGNTLISSDLGNVNDPDDDLHICTNYINDEAAWRLGFVKSITQSSSTCTVSNNSCNCSEADTLNKSEVAYTTDGRLNQHYTRSWDDQNQVWLGTVYSYNDLGLPLTTAPTYWSGDTATTISTTTTTYDKAYRSFPYKTTNAYYSLYKTYDPVYARVVEAIDANGIKASKTLDGMGRVKDVYSANPDNTKQVLVEQKQVITDTSGMYIQSKTSVDWDGTLEISREYFDGLSRKYQMESDTSAGKTIVETYEHSDVSRIKQRSSPYFKGESAHWHVADYDSIGRLHSISQPMETPSVTILGYDIQKLGDYYQSYVSRTEYSNTPQARTVTAYLDPWGKTLQKNLPQIKGQAASTVTIDYTRLGKIHSMTTPGNVTTTVSYDSLGRKLSTVNPYHGTTTWRYDPKGMLQEQVSATSSSISYTYDVIGRIKTRHVKQPNTPTRTITYGYDSPNQKYAIGRLSSVNDSGIIAASYVYNYDALGRRTNSTMSLDGKSYTLSSAYDPLSRVTQQTFPDNSFTKKHYNVEGPLNTLAFCTDANNCRDIATYSKLNASGQAQHVAYGNQVDTQYEYDQIGRIHQAVASKGGNTLLNKTYQWQALDQVKSVTDAEDAAMSISFDYYTPGYLKSATRNNSTTNYQYDEAGNLAQRSNATEDKTLIFTTIGQQVQSATINGAAYASLKYDPAGNMRTKTLEAFGSDPTQEWAFDYDASNQLTHIAKADKHTIFTYDYKGALLRKDAPDGTITYYISRGYELTKLPDGSIVTTKTLSGPSGTVASVSTKGDEPEGNTHFEASKQTLSPGANGSGMPVAGEMLYFHHDQVGSTQLVTDASGAIHARMAYEPFGSIATLSYGVDSFRAKFDGLEWEYNGQLYHSGARFYDPLLGRFIGADNRLVGAGQFNAAGFNQYSFSGNNPIFYSDPSGHFAWGEVAVIGASIGLTAAVVALTIVQPELALPVAIVGAGVIGAYVGGETVNHQQNPLKWNYDSWKTYAGMAGGAAISAVGVAVTMGAPMMVPAEYGALSVGVGIASGTLVGAGQSAAFAAMGGDNVAQIAEAAVQGGAFGLMGSGMGAGGEADEAFDPAATRMQLDSAEENAGTTDFGQSGGNSGDPAGAACSASFAPDTVVHTTNGLKPIQKITTSDWVLSYDTNGKTIAKSKVYGLKSREVEQDVWITTTDNTNFNSTTNHPFYVKDKGWIEAKDLHVGDRLVIWDNSESITVASLRLGDDTPSRVYSIEVHDWHNYFVGEDGVLVSNYECGELNELASQLHARSYAQGRSLRSAVTAVGELQDSEGNTFLVTSTSSSPVSNARMDAIGEYLDEQGIARQDHVMGAHGEHLHAEMAIMRYANREGYTVLRVGVSAEVCPQCQEVLDTQGAEWSIINKQRTTPSQWWDSPYDSYAPGNMRRYGNEDNVRPLRARFNRGHWYF